MATREQGLDMESLEGMVDRHGLKGVMDMLTEICGEKAEHIRTNWQDNLTAKRWDHDGAWLEKASHGIFSDVR